MSLSARPRGLISKRQATLGAGGAPANDCAGKGPSPLPPQATRRLPSPVPMGRWQGGFREAGVL